MNVIAATEYIGNLVLNVLPYLAVFFGISALIVYLSCLFGQNVDRDLLAEKGLPPDYYPPKCASLHEGPAAKFLKEQENE